MSFVNKTRLTSILLSFVFKNRLDDHWKSEEIKYDFERDLSSFRGNNV